MSDAKQNAKPTGQLFHTEIRSANPSATASFMKENFGWSIQDTPHPDYKIIETPGGFEGHIGPVPDDDKGPSATNYVMVKDIEAAEKAIVDNGGKILVSRQEAPGQGFYTWFEAPGGIKMVVWQNTSA